MYITASNICNTLVLPDIRTISHYANKNKRIANVFSHVFTGTTGARPRQSARVCQQFTVSKHPAFALGPSAYPGLKLVNTSVWCFVLRVF